VHVARLQDYAKFRGKLEKREGSSVILSIVILRTGGGNDGKMRDVFTEGIRHGIMKRGGSISTWKWGRHLRDPG